MSHATEPLHAFLAPGLRTIDAEGCLSPDGTLPFDESPALAVIDLEMSGPNAQVHEVLDVGVVVASVAPGFPEQSSWGSRIRPRRIGNADRGALKVVRYRPKDWKDAPELEAVFEELAGLGPGSMLAGWGLEMDLAFLGHTFRYLGMDWPFANTVVEIQEIARTVLRGSGQVDRYNLGHVADRLGIGRMGEHSALADAYAAYDVLVQLWARREASV